MKGFQKISTKSFCIIAYNNKCQNYVVHKQIFTLLGICIFKVSFNHHLPT